MMKILLVGVIAAAIAAPMVANAIDGTITINGKVYANTCKINGAAQPFAQTYTLPPVPTSSLATVGAVANPTPIQLNFTGCDTGLTALQTYWDGGGSGVVATSGNIKSTGTSNAEIRLLNGSGTPVNLTPTTNTWAGAAAQGNSVVALSSGSGTVTYQAEYYAPAAATAGTVAGVATFTLVYQ